jgi:hypothetical protein
VEECVYFEIWVAVEEEPSSITFQQIYLVLQGVYGDVDDDGLNQILIFGYHYYCVKDYFGLTTTARMDGCLPEAMISVWKKT